MKKIFLIIFYILVAVYILICTILYFNQEKLIFFPEKLPKNFKFSFAQNFEEINIQTDKNTSLNGLLFKAENSKGLIFYLHGNAGSLRTWGEVAKTYTDLSYDVFVLDYRGYGKSDGKIDGESQIFQDVQIAYSEMTKRYTEDKIIVLGYSIGTGPAAKLASTNHPQQLILQAPYYSLKDLMKHMFPVIPTFILKYKFTTNEYIKDCKMPIVLFHGRQDEVIYYESSVKLKALMKKEDQLITLEGQGHNGITENAQYKVEIAKVLK